MHITNLRFKSKLAIFNALSKLVIVSALLFIVPWIVSEITIRNTDDLLIKKLDQVILLVDSLGIDNYINIDNEIKAFGSYNILKEEFVSIEQLKNDTAIDVIEYSERIIENELVEYRVLSYSIEENGKTYLIEIGRSISTIIQFEQNLKRFAFLFLLIIILITFVVDISFIQFLLNPFEKIVKKLKSTNHPSEFDYTPIKTQTFDFAYLNNTINGLMIKIEDAFNNEREYISNVSHELLTPISIIQSKLDNILSDQSLSDEVLLKIMDSKQTIMRLTNMVRTLLMMSRIENEEYLLNEQVDLSILVADVTEEIEDKVLAKELQLNLDLDKSINPITGNENLLFILVYNLLNNAIRYTEHGSISIKTRLINNQIQLAIKDTGIGIKQEEIPHIFSRFKNFTNQKDSFGLGLALAKKICDYHKIDIQVSSELNMGTTFTLQFNN
ncbi:MAG: HAMP domain-containing sensor histidine kinase [Bacteroidales bacterium]|jgi:signal transduction histidine kinase|nr:HAMP domain-containing sensor histidine kinase [Bacteroidales bacterium]